VISPRVWSRWPEDRLLDMRLCDLGLKIERTPLEACIRRIHRELDRRHICFRPHFWLSEEWFTPDGVPGAAIPFYLAHWRLERLERNQMLEVEGGTHKWCMRILRHEVGHAVDHAYQLHRRREWQRLFGKTSQPYPERYVPNPNSRHYVLHLDHWYAQSHPDEDFAETFAVWLKPRAMWRKRYQGWPALRKLEYVDRLMAEIADQPPTVRSRRVVEPLHRIRTTLRELYERKQTRYSQGHPNFYDRDLRRLFSGTGEGGRQESAAAFIRRHGREVRRMVSRWTREYQYTLDLVVKEMIGRCQELNLFVEGPLEQVKMDLSILLTVETMNYIHSGRRRLLIM
jgi:Putative zinc-binding metallo-peptidase